jgi:hypothetical protein
VFIVAVVRLPAFSCPHCDGPARVRQSRDAGRTFRELLYACQDVTCGFTFRCELVATHTISPSARPDPDVKLPLWRPAASNDNAPSVAAAGR